LSAGIAFGFRTRIFQEAAEDGSGDAAVRGADRLHHRAFDHWLFPKTEEARILATKSDDQPTDVTATKNMVTNTASTSMNITAIPSSILGRSL
jgi:hypothetical protein